MVEITAPVDCKIANIDCLIGPSTQSKDHVTFAGAAVGENGTWSPFSAVALPGRSNKKLQVKPAGKPSDSPHQAHLFLRGEFD